MKNVIRKAMTGCFMMALGFMVLNQLVVNKAQAAVVTPGVTEWKQSSTGTWPGMKDGQTYWYKLDNKAMLWWSTDGKTWEQVKDQDWADKSGKWLKISHKKLVWSADGKTWSEVPEWKWEGSDGKWYKFDSKWMLWVNE